MANSFYKKKQTDQISCHLLRIQFLSCSAGGAPDTSTVVIFWLAGCAMRYWIKIFLVCVKP